MNENIPDVKDVMRRVVRKLPLEKEGIPVIYSENAIIEALNDEVTGYWGVGKMKDTIYALVSEGSLEMWRYVQHGKWSTVGFRPVRKE